MVSRARFGRVAPSPFEYHWKTRIPDRNLNNGRRIVLSNRKWIWPGLALVAVTAIVGIGWTKFDAVDDVIEAIEAVPVRGFVKDMEPVELYSQNGRGAGTRLRIPAAYMQWQDNRKGGLDRLITLIAVYPEMTPYALLPREERRKFETWEIARRPLRFDPLIHVRAALPQGLDRLHFSEFLEPANRVTSDESSFIAYRASWAGVTRDYFVPVKQDKSGAALECLPLPAGSTAESTHTNCTAYVQFSDRILITYTVPRRDIDQWRAIDEKVRALIKAFVVDCFDGPVLPDGGVPTNFHACAD